MTINSLSIFDLLTSIARLSKQLRLHDRAFSTTKLLDYFYRSTATGLVEIEVVPIKHMSAQTLQHAYFSIISDYIHVIKSLHGVTISLIQNVCTDFGIYISRFLFFLLYKE